MELHLDASALKKALLRLSFESFLTGQVYAKPWIWTEKLCDPMTKPNPVVKTAGVFLASVCDTCFVRNCR